ncbi:hypothetical protein N5C66_16960 [Rhizobium pusense]|nr:MULTISPECIES: hypothetical protein [Rhizobium/Agrobacterium group]MCW8279543.1 hypothetical protein [Agrobacterium sp. InxBP2]MDH0910855.1 hypothetical protein [Agrobacterium pusense]MDH1097610.1 hypothetical protein [Agrobacterium pusense]MDH1113427.1 hypothetical protein [Agrobacterium pusense]MDH2195890.1 hypothetical protein [Agrobacterium pusense]
MAYPIAVETLNALVVVLDRDRGRRGNGQVHVTDQIAASCWRWPVMPTPSPPEFTVSK